MKCDYGHGMWSSGMGMALRSQVLARGPSHYVPGQNNFMRASYTRILHLQSVWKGWTIFAYLNASQSGT